MRILHILPALNAGGAEMMLTRLVGAHRADASIEHRVISLRSDGRVGALLEAQGVRVESLGLTSLTQLPQTIVRLRRLIQAARPDIVHTWMYHADLFGGLAARAAGVRRILWSVRIADISPEMGVARPTFWIRRACALLSRRVPSRILYVAESARPPHEALGYEPSKAVVIPNGYDVPPARAPGERQALRRRIGLPEDALLVGSAGRLSEQKDFPTFIRAAALLAGEFPRARFVLMGRQLDDANEELVSLVRATGFTDRFLLLGERRDIGDCLAALDVFCLHSVQEGFPNVVAEAMAQATPCVVTDVGDAALLVGETAEVVEPRRPEVLAAALGRMLASEAAERDALGRAARARIETLFSIDAVAAQYAALYRELMAS
jgi:glycosyltransferase involved in cell wall biosynthesis